MLLFGHRFIKNDSFYHISDTDAIANTPPSSTIYIKFEEKNVDLMEYANANALEFALGVEDVNELIYGSALNASYLIVQKELAKTAQKIAENYLFDSKILVRIEDEQEIAEMAILGIDGVVFSNAIIKINS
jgi:hypothetical protein